MKNVWDHFGGNLPNTFPRKNSTAKRPEMGRKALLVAPAAAVDAPLERFHADATDAPLLSVVVWTTSAGSRQLAIARGGQTLLELQRVQPPEGSRSWFVGNNVQQGAFSMVAINMWAWEG